MEESSVASGGEELLITTNCNGLPTVGRSVSVPTEESFSVRERMWNYLLSLFYEKCREYETSVSSRRSRNRRVNRPRGAPTDTFKSIFHMRFEIRCSAIRKEREVRQKTE